MKRYLFILFVCSTNTQADEAERVFNAVRDSVVTLTVYDERKEVDGAGSGVVVAPGRVVTNCHVVQEAVAIRVRAGDKEWDATIAVMDTPRDLCQLDVPGLMAPFAKIRRYQDIQIGEPIYAVGNPLGFGLAVSAGLVSSIGLHKGETRLFSSAPISPGSSGGGLFDGQGRLIGITTGFYPGAQNLNLAVPADWINEIPKRGVAWRAPAAAIPDPDWIGESESLRLANKWAELAALSRRWREAYPTSATANVYLGLALVNTKQAAEAKVVLLKAVQQDPNHANALSYLAQARYQLGEKEAALADLQHAITLFPIDGFYYYTLGLWQYQKGDFEGAVGAAQNAIKFDPSNEFNWDLLGESQQRKHRYVEAAQAYRTVLRLKPHHPVATTNLVSVLATLGEVGTARQVLTDAPPGLASDASVWLQVGYAEDKQSHYAEAERAYRKALEIDPTLADAWYYLGRYLVRVNRDTEAEEAFRQVLKHKPGMASAWAALAEITKRQGDNAGAKEAYEKATVLDPLLALAWYGLGTARRELNDYAGAVKALEQAARLDPKSTVWAVLGEALLRAGRPGEALKALQEAEKLNPKDEFTLQVFTLYYGQSGDPNKSLDYALRSLEVNSATAQNWNNKGYALLKLQRYAQAIPAFETATRLQPDLIAAWVNLGEANLRSKQLGKAITALEQALKLAPRSTDARLFIAQAYAGSGQFAKGKEELGLLLRQAPNFASAWVLMTVMSLSEDNKPEALAAYHKLKLINPVMARELSVGYRKQNPMSNIVLPY